MRHYIYSVNGRGIIVHWMLLLEPMLVVVVGLASTKTREEAQEVG